MMIYGDREAKVFSEEADNTFLDLHNSLDYKKAESKNALLLIKIILSLKNNLKHSYLDVKFLSSFAGFIVSSGNISFHECTLDMRW